MSDDLVKRLRSASNGYYAGVKLHLTEAADRIERLEAELREAEGTIWSLVETTNSLGGALCGRKTDD